MPGFLLGLRDFFRERVTLERAEREVKDALAARGENFLARVGAEVFGRPAGPYFNLLKFAGCEFGDIEAAVRRDGVEATLDRLARAGVYLTAEEFKGKKEVTRGGRSFAVDPGAFDRAQTPGFVGRSSGTANPPMRSTRPLDWLATRSYASALFFSAHRVWDDAHAVYDAILPGTAINHLMINAKLGKPTDRWFAREVPFRHWAGEMSWHATTWAIVLAGKCFGPGFPRPEFTALSELDRVVRWITAERRRGKKCFITTVASSAARIARVAWKMGESLKGAKFYVAGEPFTEAKEEALGRVEATATSRFSYGGGVPVGYGCANPSARDEIHVNQHLLAVILRPDPVGATPIHPLLLTTLAATAPKFLLNVESGDYAAATARDCGCALEKAGLTLHLHDIGSYEKFTSEGMNYSCANLFDLMEKILPREFGGGPGDYQLVESEEPDGQTHITLRVHPVLGVVDEARLLSRMSEEMAKGSWGNEFQARLWRDAGTFKLTREAPHESDRGKILPLHIARR